MDIADLRLIFLFDGLSDEQLGDLIAAGDEVRFDAGDLLFRQGEAASFLWVLIEGQVELLRRGGQDESVIGVMDRPGVWAGGFRAWADQAGYLATGRAASPGRMFRVAGRGPRHAGPLLVPVRRAHDRGHFPDGA